MNREEAQAWEELLEAYHREPDPSSTPSWPEAENLDSGSGAVPDADSATGDERDLRDAGGTDDGGPAGSIGPAPESDDERSEPYSSAAPTPGPRDHVPPEIEDRFVPPDPPPLPRGNRITRLAWAGALGSPVLAVLLVLTGISPPDVVLVAMVAAFVAGCVTLIARMRSDDDPGPDSGGAVL